MYSCCNQRVKVDLQLIGYSALIIYCSLLIGLNKIDRLSAALIVIILHVLFVMSIHPREPGSSFWQIIYMLLYAITLTCYTITLIKYYEVSIKWISILIYVSVNIIAPITICIYKHCKQCKRRDPLNYTQCVVNVDTQKICSICLNTIDKNSYVIILPCNDMFHSACISQWLNNHQTCPNCKTDCTTVLV